jgi:hypothetical protein
MMHFDLQTVNICAAICLLFSLALANISVSKEFFNKNANQIRGWRKNCEAIFGIAEAEKFIGTESFLPL